MFARRNGRSIASTFFRDITVSVTRVWSHLQDELARSLLRSPRSVRFSPNVDIEPHPSTRIAFRLVVPSASLRSISLIDIPLKNLFPKKWFLVFFVGILSHCREECISASGPALFRPRLGRAFPHNTPLYPKDLECRDYSVSLDLFPVDCFNWISGSLFLLHSSQRHSNSTLLEATRRDWKQAIGSYEELEFNLQL